MVAPIKKPIIAEMWEEWWNHVKPANAPEIQRLEMRRAFFSGMLAMMTKIADRFDSEHDNPTAEDLQFMENVKAELDAFFDAVKNGKA